MSEADPTGMNITTPKIHVKAGTQRVSPRRSWRASTRCRTT